MNESIIVGSTGANPTRTEINAFLARLKLNGGKEIESNLEMQVLKETKEEGLLFDRVGSSEVFSTFCVGLVLAS